MKKLILISVAIFSMESTAQNLVQNWDFSQLVPNYNQNALQFSSHLGLFQFTSWGSMISLDNVSTNGMGLHLIGSLQQNRPGVGVNPKPYTGLGYGGILSTVVRPNINYPSGSRSLHSFAVNELNYSLHEDTTYCVEYFIRGWVGYSQGYYRCWTHDKYGVYFDSIPSLPTILPWFDSIMPQVWNNIGYIDYYDEWRQVKGSFTAQGHEKYLIFGNYDPFSTPPIQYYHGPNGNGNGCSPEEEGILVFDAFMVYNCNDTVFHINLQDSVLECYGEPVLLTPEIMGFKLEDSLTMYRWETPAGSISTTDTFLLANEPGTYSLEVEINKRFKATKTVHVKWMEPEPDTILLPEHLAWCLDDVHRLRVPYIEYADYLWSTGDTLTWIDVTRPGVYSLNINHPCWVYDQDVEVELANCGENIWIPNAFSPNGDGVNDYFEIHGSLLPVTLIVTDRWGQVVFESTDYQNDWDGTYNGQPLPPAVYAYRVVYNKVDGGVNYQKYGTITLVK